MSQENVEFVKSLYTTREATDKYQLLAALPELVEQVSDREIEWQTHRGHAGVVRSFERWLEGFDRTALQ
jgi:hypothetical protein